MQPLAGVITKIRKDIISVLLTSGTTIKGQREKKFNLGSRVKVFYDFTQMRVRDIILENEFIEGCDIEPTGDENTDSPDFYDPLLDIP